MPFEPGNQEGLKANRHRAKLIRDALLVAAKRVNEDGIEALQRAADATMAAAMAGDIQAFREIADRIDGKVPQGHGGDADLPAISVINEIRRTFVDPRPADGKDIPPAV